MSKELLHKINNMFEIIDKHSKEIFWVIDIETMELIYVSESFDSYIKEPLESYKKDGHYRIPAPSTRNNFFKTVDQMLKDEKENKLKEPFIERFEFETQDKKKLIFDMSMTFIRNDNNEPIGIFGISRDFSEKLAGISILNREDIILETLMNTSPDSIVLFDKSMTVIKVNLNACKLANISQDKFIGSHFLDFTIPEWRQKAIEAKEAIDKAGKITNEHFTFLRPDGTTFPAEHSVSAIKKSLQKKQGVY